jgi:hypothetical protein
MNSTIVIPQLSGTLVSGEQEVISQPAKTIFEKRVRPVEKALSSWLPWKLEDILEGLLAVLSVIYFIGAATFACILLFNAFNS